MKILPIGNPIQAMRDRRHGAAVTVRVGWAVCRDSALAWLPNPKLGHHNTANNSMRKFISPIFMAGTLILAGCFTASHSSQWEYMTVVTQNDAVPLDASSK
jgi:hypothetical protein